MSGSSMDDLMRLDEALARRARETPRPQIRLVPFDEIELDEEPEYLVNGLIPADGITVIWGPPKSQKSFWMYDVAMHIALGS